MIMTNEERRNKEVESDQDWAASLKKASKRPLQQQQQLPRTMPSVAVQVPLVVNTS